MAQYSQLPNQLILPSEELTHGNHMFYVRGKSSENVWSSWASFPTEVRTHMPNVPVVYHENSHAQFGRTQAIDSCQLGLCGHGNRWQMSIVTE